MADKPKSAERQMVNMWYDAALLKRIEEFRFKNRFESRTVAIRWLLSYALDQKPAVAKGE